MRLLISTVCLALSLPLLSEAAMIDSLREPGFTAMWWAEGPPHYFSMKPPPPASVLCLRSGDIGIMLDTKSLRLLHAGRFAIEQAKDAALEAATKPILELPPVDLQLSLSITGKTFICTGRGPEPKDEFFQPVRFVESGRFFQRVAIDGLQFASAEGVLLQATGNVEVALWPDRLSLTLELNDTKNLPEAELSIALALPPPGNRQRDGVGGEKFARRTDGGTVAKRASALLSRASRVTLVLFGLEPDRSLAQIEAAPSLKSEFDPALGCHIVRLPEKDWSNAAGTYYPEEHLDRLDRWPLTLVNPSGREAVARLMFTQVHHLPITGFTPMLCDPDGAPTGLPVQISKNWHRRPEKGHIAHEGPWFHGFVFVRLPPQTRRDVVFQMAYARYGGVPAASQAQLSLVGWGHNQFWDQAAIGSFGESICYEPGRVQRRCFIDDIRPLMTLPVAGGKPWGWAENCGGGDFLVWVDEQDAHRGFRATRTDYRSQGPCLTDVRYLEETAGGEIATRMEVSLARSDDYVRAFHRLRYEVRQPVKWQRLAFYQLGADYYNETPDRHVAVGDARGICDEWTLPQLSGGYDRRSVPLSGEQPWISIHGLERTALHKGSAAASRGLILRAWRARLGGKNGVGPHFSTYVNEWGKGNFKTAIELAPPPGLTALAPGDFLEAEVELVVFPADAISYYGPNESFRTALATDVDTWRLVHREASGNALRINASRGTVLRNFPLVLAVDRRNKAQAAVNGGVGWLPVTFTGLKSHRGCELRVNGRPYSQSIHGNDYWQTDYDIQTGTWSQTFNLPRVTGQPLRLEFTAPP